MSETKRLVTPEQFAQGFVERLPSGELIKREYEIIERTPQGIVVKKPHTIETALKNINDGILEREKAAGVHLPTEPQIQIAPGIPLVHAVQTVQTPTGSLTIIRPIAEKLLKEGVISGALDGVLHCTDASILKAALIQTQVCDFCGIIGATHTFDVPDFKMPHINAQSVEGWLACDECATLIRGGKKTALLNRAIDKLAFPKFSKQAIEELFNRFWHAMSLKADAAGAAAAFADFVDDKFEFKLPQHLSDRDVRITDVMKFTGLTRKQVEALSLGTVDHDALEKLVRWNASFKGQSPQQVVQQLITPVKPHLRDVTPHWQRALDRQFEALTYLSAIMKLDRREIAFEESTDLNDPMAVKRITAQAQELDKLHTLGFNEDILALRGGQAYSFNAETIEAIRQAAQSIPHDAPLSSIETPNTGAGWFWFAEPLNVQSSPIASANTHALLWSWGHGIHQTAEPAIMFSAYVIDEHEPITKLRGKVLPSTRWYWPLSLSFHDMIAYNTIKYREAYGPGGKYSGKPSDMMGEKETMHCIAELSLFFIMACVWFKQTVPILVKESGHIERHARKRMVKEHKLSEMPTVQVVALRKSARTPVETPRADGDKTPREYHYRWIVAGHPKMQPCGPGSKDRKLIWIDAYPKGPEDKPLRTRQKVYAVVR